MYLIRVPSSIQTVGGMLESGVDSEAINLSVYQEQEELCYEIQDFLELIRGSDTKHMDKWLRASKVVIEIMEKVRKQIGIIYPTD